MKYSLIAKFVLRLWPYWNAQQAGSLSYSDEENLGKHLRIVMTQDKVWIGILIRKLYEGQVREVAKVVAETRPGQKYNIAGRFTCSICAESGHLECRIPLE